MTALMYDDTALSRKERLREASQQSHAHRARSLADSDRYNGALMRTDARLNRLLWAFTLLPDAERAAFVDRALAAGRAP